MKPMVSFVVPCYKLAHLLPVCVNSILAQTYEHFEVLIMDNCSPDQTPEVARSFVDPRVKHIRNDENIGHVRNFNKGISLSGGQYVWLLSADDFLKSNRVLEQFVDVMTENPNVGFVFCQAVELLNGQEAGIRHCGSTSRIWKGRDLLKKLVQSNFIAQSSGMVRKSCFEKVGPFAIDLPFACDWYLWCLLALHYDGGYLQEPMVCCRMHEESLTTSFNQGISPVCLVDELKVLWRVARQADAAGMRSLRSICNTSLAERAAQGREPGPGAVSRPGLTEAELETLIRENVRDPDDEKHLRAHLYYSLGDEQYWSGQHRKAANSYWHGISLWPWSVKTWVKYLLLQTGVPGDARSRASISITSLGCKVISIIEGCSHYADHQSSPHARH